MNPVSHKARTGRGDVVPGYQNVRNNGFMVFTKLHEKGHLTWRACHANCLLMAAYHRAMPEHHEIYMDKARKLRKKVTWL